MHYILDYTTIKYQVEEAATSSTKIERLLQRIRDILYKNRPISDKGLQSYLQAKGKEKDSNQSIILLNKIIEQIVKGIEF